jgi:HEAT repeat protein
MDERTRNALNALRSEDRVAQNEAFTRVLAETERPVPWAYEAWDGLLADLGHKDNHVRAIAAQVLCNLARSDPQKRMLKDLPALLAVTKDKRFVTARHCLQALWRVGLAGKAQREALVAGLAGRFTECLAEKNCTLIRYDILADLRKLYDEVKDEKIRGKALELIATEEDLKYRKKYAALWRGR